MIIYVQERAPTGTTKRILASDLFMFLTSGVPKQQLTTQLSVTNVIQKTGFSSEQLKHHLENPSSGYNTLSIPSLYWATNFNLFLTNL